MPTHAIEAPEMERLFDKIKRKVGTGKAYDVPQMLSYCRVFVIGESGNADYEALQAQAGRGEIVIGYEQVYDMEGPYVKVVLKWGEPVKQEPKEVVEEADPGYRSASPTVF